MPRNDPLRNMRFRLDIDGITQAHFSEVHIGDTTTEAIDYREGTDPPQARKLPGLTKYGNIVLKWGVTDSLELYEWHRRIVSGQTADNRKSMRIVVLDETGADKASFLVSGPGRPNTGPGTSTAWAMRSSSKCWNWSTKGSSAPADGTPTYPSPACGRCATRAR